MTETEEEMNRISEAKTDGNGEYSETPMTNPIVADPEKMFENTALESLRHGFIRRNNFYIRRGVPESHRRAADNFMIIRKIFGHPVVQSKITEQEKELLERYDFNSLEMTTEKQMEEEIVFLKKWSYSNSKELQQAADMIIKIRTKELKYLIASRYVTVTDKIYSGHKILEKYFEEISKYFAEN